MGIRFALAAIQPKVMLYSLGGSLHRSSEFFEKAQENDKIVYSFWSFSCAPCMAEFPQLLQLQAKSTHARFFYINVLDPKEKIEQFAEENAIDKDRILLDERLLAAQNFRILSREKQPLLPKIFVLNKKGNIIFSSNGYTEENLAKLRAILEKK